MKRTRFAAGLLAAGLLTAALPVLPAAAAGEDFSYVLLQDGTAAVTCTNTELTAAEVPSVIDGYTVSALADGCFLENTALTEVSLPDGLTSIGAQAFYGCSSLAGITFPESLTVIGENAFFGCSALPEVSIPASVAEIGAFAFDTTEYVTSFTVSPDNAAYASQDGVLFDKDMTTLIKYPEARPDTAYTVPDPCTEIEDWAFIGAQYLEQIDLNRVTSIGEDAFYYCIALQSIAVPEGVTELIGSTFSCCTSLQSVKLPSTLKSIGENCFYSCVSLTDIALPEGLEKIGAYAFYHCTSLESLTVPASVITISSSCMGWCYDEAAAGSVVQEGFTLRFPKGSPAHTYAESNGIAWEYTAGKTFYYVLIAAAAAVIAALTIAIVRIVKK